MSEYSDSELTMMFQMPEKKHLAFNLLVRKYQEKIYYFVRRIVVDHDDADDVVQTIFIKIWNNLDGFREESKLSTWIYRVSVNEALSFLKSKRLRTFLSLDRPEALRVKTLQDDHFYSGTDIQKRLNLAILKLPAKQQLVFNLRYYDEMSYEQMSEVLGTSVGALKASFHHAVKKIEKSVLSA